MNAIEQAKQAEIAAALASAQQQGIHDGEVERMLDADEVAIAMREVAEEHAHGLALELECILLDYSGKWYASAMNKLSAYRDAMNATHERESPTRMGEPVIPATHPAQAPEQECQYPHESRECSGCGWKQEGQARELPPLPEAHEYVFSGHFGKPQIPVFTADQMREIEQAGYERGLRAAQSLDKQSAPAVRDERDEAIRNALSKLESQIARNPDLPPVYRTILNEAFAALASAPAQPTVPTAWKVGNLITMSDCDYPGMGSMFAQIWQGDDLIARVYGDTRKEVQDRAALIAAAAPVAQKGEKE